MQVSFLLEFFFVKFYFLILFRLICLKSYREWRIAWKFQRYDCFLKDFYKIFLQIGKFTNN